MTDRGRRNLIIWMVILSIPLIILILIYLAFQMTFGSLGDKRRAAQRPEVNLFTALKHAPSELDAVLFRDGTFQWYAIADPRRAANAHIKRSGPNGWSLIFGPSGNTLSCNGGSFVLQAIKDNNVVSRIGRCKKTQLDLSDLYQFADKANVINRNINAADAAELTAQIEADETLVGMQIPQYYQPFGHSFSIVLPYHWRDVDTPVRRNGLELDIEAVIAAQAPELAGLYSFSSNSHLVIKRNIDTPISGTDESARITGQLIMRDDESYVLTDLVDLRKVTVNMRCNQPACDTLRSLDYSAASDAARDLAALDKALGAAIVLEEDLANIPVADVQESDLRQDMIRMTPMQEALYRVIYANLAP